MWRSGASSTTAAGVHVRFAESTEQTTAHRVPFIRVNHNTGSSAAMSSGTQYMLQKNPRTRLPFAYIWYLDSSNNNNNNNNNNRVGIRNVVWPKMFM